LEAPAGSLRLTTDAIMEDCGTPEPAQWSAQEHSVRDLPEHTLQYLLASRYCEIDLLMADAWRLFGDIAPGWSRVQAICNLVNQHVTFGYQFARPTKTALETYREGQGVCRDLAHLAIAFCRCLNIPARYCTSYLGDIGVPAVDAPMDFAGCMEVYLGGAWHIFDPRNNARRIGRIIIARGRDAADVAISTAFGAPCLQSFRVWTDEISDQRTAELWCSGLQGSTPTTVGSAFVATQHRPCGTRGATTREIVRAGGVRPSSTSGLPTNENALGRKALGRAVDSPVGDTAVQNAFARSMPANPMQGPPIGPAFGRRARPPIHGWRRLALNSPKQERW